MTPKRFDSDSVGIPTGPIRDLARTGVPDPDQRPYPSNPTAKPAAAVSDLNIRRDIAERELRKRGIDNPASVLIDAATADDFEGVEGAIRWWDDRRASQPTMPGLLVKVIREGGKPGYGERREATLQVTPKLLNAVRGRCLSIDGCWRYEVLDMYEEAAARRGLTADELISQAMGPQWMVTPPHPARLHTLNGMEVPRWMDRYQALIGERPSPDPRVQRWDGEDIAEFSARFWRWTDPFGEA